MNAPINAKVLVVDDEEDLRDIIEYQFKTNGYEVNMAKDGVEALEVLKSFEPDLIILDLNMPRMGGIEFYQKICGADGRPKFHILVLTARANTRQLFMDFAVDGFITKPFEAPDLLNEAQIIIRKSREKLEQKKEYDLKAAKNIIIVDEQSQDLCKISEALASAGYKVSSATSGTRGIEKMMEEVPDVALINLGLKDIPGDIVVQRLMHMSKTKDIKFILYVHRNNQHDPNVIEGFGRKEGVLACFEYTTVKEFLELIDGIIAKGENEARK